MWGVIKGILCNTPESVCPNIFGNNTFRTKLIPSMLVINNIYLAKYV